MKARFSEQRHPFYRPLGVRIAIVAVVAGWLLFELLVIQNMLWIVVAGAALAYAVYMFFISWPKDEARAPDRDDRRPPA